MTLWIFALPGPCDPECSDDGCEGPSPQQCVTCLHFFLKFKNNTRLAWLHKAQSTVSTSRVQSTRYVDMHIMKIITYYLVHICIYYAKLIIFSHYDGEHTPRMSFSPLSLIYKITLLVLCSLVHVCPIGCVCQSVPGDFGVTAGVVRGATLPAWAALGVAVISALPVNQVITWLKGPIPAQLSVETTTTSTTVVFLASTIT